ncbi:Leukocyte immunoglobulin-like receptor subfamily A member 6 [Myotis davidii]|nr:Leukocyte immunoglobulin-like receptor subfamily A member 6 [Myotis davidii]
MTEHDGGRYSCYYNSPTGWSEPSDPLELQATGEAEKPSLLSQQGPIVASGQSLTLQCRSDVSYDRFALHKEGEPDLSQSLVLQPQAGLSQAHFPLDTVSSSHGGRYRCYGGYSLSSAWSTPSDPLDILVAGHLPDRPSLSVKPGPRVASGENVTLLCQSQSWRDTFLLSKDGAAGLPLHLRSKHRARRYQAEFSMSPVTSAHEGTYRCYSSHSISPFLLSLSSEPLQFLVSGESGKPNLLSQQGPIVASGQNLTLQCRSDVGYDRFALHKEGRRDLPQSLILQPQAGLSQAHFPLDTVSSSHGGRYRCYGGYNLSSEWSAPSDPLEILVAGHLSDRPSISVQPGPRVASGENVTLLCQSQSWRDTFLLSKDGAAGLPLHLRSEHQGWQYQAEFSMSPVTSAHGGTYRCYRAHSISPFLLSHPSEPLQLLVSGPSGGPSPPSTRPMSTGADAVVKDPQPGESVELDPQNRQDEDPQGVTYAQVKHSRPRPRQGMATSPSSLSGGLLNKKGRQAEKDRKMDSQAVAYAQLNHLTLRQKTCAPPSSLSEKPPDEPSVYAALSVY